jgi:hypothetical protein
MLFTEMQFECSIRPYRQLRQAVLMGHAYFSKAAASPEGPEQFSYKK